MITRHDPVVNDPAFLNTIRTATPFPSEAELIKVVLAKVTKFFDGDCVFASTEVPVGAGTVDVIAGQTQNSNLTEHKRHAITSKQAYVLSKLYHKQRLSLRTIARRTEVAESELESILCKLCENDFAVKFGNCYVRQESMFMGLTSIEGKIKDWKRALQQANRNRLFSTQSFVALDARYAKSALANLDLFKQYQVGLAIVFHNADMHIVYHPPVSTPLAPVMPIIAESALLECIAKKPAFCVEQ
jgi:hypothetical protein